MTRDKLDELVQELLTKSREASSAAEDIAALVRAAHGSHRDTRAKRARDIRGIKIALDETRRRHEIVVTACAALVKLAALFVD